jgi:hypothetical protein
MRSRLITNVLLLVVIAGLGAVAFFQPGKDRSDPTPIAAVDPNGLAAISLTNTESIVFEKQAGHWRLTAPFQAPANEIRVQQLIDIAKSGSAAQYPFNPADRAKFELDKPKATLVLGPTTLEFGGSDPIDLRRYVLVGSTLYLVDDDFFHHLTAAATDFVDKKLLPESAKVREINIPGLNASLGDDGKWARQPPGDGKPDLTELATLWATARAIDVKRLEKPAEGDPVRIGLADEKPVEFVILQREPDVILARQDLGLQFELTGDTGQQLLNLPKSKAAGRQPVGTLENSEAGAGEDDEDGSGEEIPAAGEDDTGGGANSALPTKPASADKSGGS